MKLNIFFVRSFSVIMMLALTSVSAILALVMYCLSSVITGQQFYFPWLLLGDELIPLLLFVLALIFRNRFCALVAIIVSFTNIFLRFFAIIIFKESYMPLDYSSLKLLMEHTDLGSLQAILGSGFYFWLIPGVLLFLSLVTYCAMLTWKTADKSSRKISRRSLVLFSILLGLSLFSNLAFHVIQKYAGKDHFLSIKPLPLIVVNLTHDSISDLYSDHEYKAVPLPAESRKVLEKINFIAPENSVREPGTAVFDKIIILAVESLDYDFIGRNNPEMPENITPNLDRLSAEYPSMNNYFAASQPTSWGLSSIILSRLDYNRDRHMTPPSLFTLAGKNGYESYYFSAVSGHFGNNRNTYRLLFQADKNVFLEEWQKNYPFKQLGSWGLSDNNLFQGVFQELKGVADKHYIAIISTIDTHPPFTVHKDFPEAEKQRFPMACLQALHNTDREIGSFIRQVMAEPKIFDDRTLIIITADHTATFGDLYYKRNDFVPGRIPLILICKNKEIFRDLNLNKYASSIDLPPTLLKLIGGGDLIPDTFAGRDLFSDKNHALTRLQSDVLIIYSPEGELWVDPRKKIDEPTEKNKPENTLTKAFSDFYRSLYGDVSE